MKGAIFVEEESARTVILSIATRLELIEQIIVIPHAGKNDLEKSFARKIVAWKHPVDMRFVISRDNDGANCSALKRRLASLVPAALMPRVKIRIIMQELESWYLGDLEAIAKAGLINAALAAGMAKKALYREPDRLTNASDVFQAMCRGVGKISAARQIAPHFSYERNRSASFHAFVDALRWAASNR